MITRNLTKLLIRMTTGQDAKYVSLTGDVVQSNINFFDRIGKTLHAATNSDSYNRYHTTKTIRIGTGNTEPTFDDYKLEQMLDIEPVNIMMTGNNNSDETYCILTAVFNNNTDSDWTVSEIGLIAGIINGTHSALFAREVFEPVIVKPGQVFSGSIKLF